MKTETLVVKHSDNGQSIRLRILAGDRVSEINSGPSQGYNGTTWYNTGKLITNSMRRSKWYKTAQFDECGNSDWLN